jgi:hypothetical protein
MTNDARKRVSRGVPTGGQFATENKHRTLLAPQNEGASRPLTATDGSVFWRKPDGSLDREGGPAVELTSGTKFWYKNGEKHREHGPAVEHSDGSAEWWINGQRRPDLEGDSNSTTNSGATTPLPLDETGSKKLCAELFADVATHLDADVSEGVKGTRYVTYNFGKDKNCWLLASVNETGDEFKVTGIRENRMGHKIRGITVPVPGANIEDAKRVMYEMAIEIQKSRTHRHNF